MSAKPRHQVVRSTKTPESLTALRTWLGTFEESVRKRGTSSYETGLVTALRGNADHYVEADITDEEKLHAMELLLDPNPPMEKQFGAKIWQPEGDALEIPAG